MSKPLELTIYPHPNPPMPSGLRDEKGWDAYYDAMEQRRQQFLKQQAKRLTEAELCAEYESARCDAMIQSATGQCWSSLFDTWPMDPAAIHNRERTLLRFASRPHYFEATEPESDTE